MEFFFLNSRLHGGFKLVVGLLQELRIFVEVVNFYKMVIVIFIFLS